MVKQNAYIINEVRTGKHQRQHCQTFMRALAKPEVDSRSVVISESKVWLRPDRRQVDRVKDAFHDVARRRAGVNSLGQRQTARNVRGGSFFGAIPACLRIFESVSD